MRSPQPRRTRAEPHGRRKVLRPHVSPQAHDFPPDVGLGPPASPDAKDGPTECQPVAVIKSSSSRAGERWWWWCLSTHARSRFIVGVLCPWRCLHARQVRSCPQRRHSRRGTCRPDDRRASASDGQHHEVLTERGGFEWSGDRRSAEWRRVGGSARRARHRGQA